jgi:hypothetical protein
MECEFHLEGEKYGKSTYPHATKGISYGGFASAKGNAGCPSSFGFDQWIINERSLTDLAPASVRSVRSEAIAERVMLRVDYKNIRLAPGITRYTL